MPFMSVTEPPTAPSAWRLESPLLSPTMTSGGAMLLARTPHALRATRALLMRRLHDARAKLGEAEARSAEAPGAATSARVAALRRWVERLQDELIGASMHPTAQMVRNARGPFWQHDEVVAEVVAEVVEGVRLPGAWPWSPDYLTWFIRRSIPLAIARLGGLHLSPGQRTRVAALISMMPALRHQMDTLGRLPSPEEFSHEFEVALSSSRMLMALGLWLRSGGYGSPSIDAMTDASQALQEKARAEQMRKVLKTLAPREEKVLSMFFDIDAPSEHTPEAVGRDIDVTRERIRQIEEKALRKLRDRSKKS